MKNYWLLKLSSVIYMVMAFLFIIVLFWWEDVSDGGLDNTVVGVAIFLSCLCGFLGFTAYRLQHQSYEKRRKFSIFAAVICGLAASIGGWFGGVIFGLPLLIALLGMPDFWTKLLTR
jgi:hypothetical protein